MAQITGPGFLRHLRAEPNQYILHYSGGNLARKGPGLAYWFSPLSAAVAQVPVEDVETTFVLNERSVDYQEITVQVTLSYRLADPERAAQRVNLSISLESGAWLEQPLERLASLWSHWAQQPVRACLTAMPLTEAVTAGPEKIRAALDLSLRANREAEEMGLSLVAVQVDQVSATAEMEKALQTPTRESIQQKADEATFQRRAMAVEKERAIKENELATEIEMARRQEDLIRRQGANNLLEQKQQNHQAHLEAEAEAARTIVAAKAAAEETRISGEGQAEALRLRLKVQNDAEERRVKMWKDAPPGVSLGLAAQAFAGKVQNIRNLNVTPDLMGTMLQDLLTGTQAKK